MANAFHLFFVDLLAILPLVIIKYAVHFYPIITFVLFATCVIQMHRITVGLFSRIVKCACDCNYMPEVSKLWAEESINP